MKMPATLSVLGVVSTFVHQCEGRGVMSWSFGE